MKLLAILVYEFFLIGSFAVGGGLATIPFLIQLTEKYSWFSFSTLMDMIAISESTPGPIGINMATYVGYVVSGPLGSIFASIAVFIPGLIMMMLIGRSLEKFKNSPLLSKIFYGIRPTITALIGFAALTMIVAVVNDLDLSFVPILSSLFVFGFTILLVRKFQVSPVLIILFSALLSLVIPF